MGVCCWYFGFQVDCRCKKVAKNEESDEIIQFEAIDLSKIDNLLLNTLKYTKQINSENQQKIWEICFPNKTVSINQTEDITNLLSLLIMIYAKFIDGSKIAVKLTCDGIAKQMAQDIYESLKIHKKEICKSNFINNIYTHINKDHSVLYCIVLFFCFFFCFLTCMTQYPVFMFLYVC